MNMRMAGIPFLFVAIVLLGCNMQQQAHPVRRPQVRFVTLDSDNRVLHEPHAQDTARIVASHLSESIATVERGFHRPFVKDVQVKIFDSADNFAAHTGVSIQEWGVMVSGTVFLSGIVKTAPADHIGALLTHELVHLYLQQWLVESARPPTTPMWFEEGLAELVSERDHYGLKKAKERILEYIAVRSLKPKKERHFGTTEHPTWIEEMVAALGAEPVEYRNKMLCCGAGGGVRGYDIVHSLDITNEKLINLKEARVDALTEICPFCQLQFDRGQIEIEEKFGVKYNLPVAPLLWAARTGTGNEPSGARA